MIIASSLEQLLSARASMTNRVGLVPTMGYLHQGHESLIRKSISENAHTIVSIYVNPSQFGEGEDFERYPRDHERDISILESLGADVLFLPDNAAVYPPGYRTYVHVSELEDRLCGESRPGHFRGVATIVLKLINLTAPHIAYFGKKDAQQLIIIKRMLRDLNLGCEIGAVEIQRNDRGLALSSRNSYLSEEGKTEALVLSESLKYAGFLVRDKKILDTSRIRREMEGIIHRSGSAKIDYIATVSTRSLQHLDEVEPEGTLIAIAVFIENVRLIDNIIVGEI